MSLEPATARALILLAGWVSAASATVALLLYTGAGYSAVLPLLVIAAIAFFALSPSRWHSLQRWLWADREIAPTWTPRVAVVIIMIALLWLILTILLFLAGNPAILE